MTSSRIVLYSDQEIPENRRIDLKLSSLLSETKKDIAYVASSPEESRFYFERKKRYYSLLGIDLAEYFDQQILESSDARKRLVSYSAIHLSGGNTFAFRNWVFSQGVDAILTQYCNSGGMLIGTSAGAILMTPDISTAILCGDGADKKDGTSGLNLVDFCIWPHYEKSDENKNTFLLIDNSIVLFRIPDGSGIAVSNSKTELIGNVKV